MNINCTQTTSPQPPCAREVQHLCMLDDRKLVEVRKEIEHHISLLDRSERQLLDNQRMAPHAVIAEKGDKRALRTVQMIDPN